MKKVLAICLTMVMVLSMSVNVLAAPNGFDESPSGRPAPTVVDQNVGDDDCTAELVITPYGDRYDLTEELREQIEKAYDDIVDSNSLTELNKELEDLAEEKGIDPSDLAVSDLFTIHPTDCDDHDGHKEFDITLDADTLEKFVGLLLLNENGEWELVTDAKVVNNGEHLKFSSDLYTAYAIVIDTSAGAHQQTGDNSMIYVWAIIMAASALAIVVIAVTSKKKRG